VISPSDGGTELITTLKPLAVLDRPERRRRGRPHRRGRLWTGPARAPAAPGRRIC